VNSAKRLATNEPLQPFDSAGNKNKIAPPMISQRPALGVADLRT
jgi:hypothetical protein